MRGIGFFVLAILATLTQFANAQERWGAVAVGLDEGGSFGTSYVGAGSAMNHSSRSSAEAAALRGCRDGASNCRILTTFNTGCYYVTVGKNSRGQVGWGSDQTASGAVRQCESRGLICKQAIGGCVGSNNSDDPERWGEENVEFE